MGIANRLTFLRIAIGPLFLLVYTFHGFLGISQQSLPYWLLLIFAIGEGSDALDGYFARKFQEVSDFGKIVDPLADSLSRLTYLFTFTTGVVQLPMALAFIFFYRDALISTLRTLCALHGFALAARNSGKFKAAIQATTIFIIILCMIPQSTGEISGETLTTIATWATAFAALFTLYSAYDYVKANIHHVKRLLQPS